jgi:hypothetical protein
MSEYQYYEFQAIDHPLSAADREELRALSTRARITSTSFTNSYEWGDFKGDPAKLMEKWFDLHLYLANWGTRRLMIRWPARMVDRPLLAACLRKVDTAKLRSLGKNLILDICVEEVESEDWDDGAGWLAALAPLRTDVLGGDLRLFYLLWLSAVEADIFQPDQPEPMPGIGPMTGALEAFADFFGIDADLVAAAAERSAGLQTETPPSLDTVRPIVEAMRDEEKNHLLLRLFQGDQSVMTELRARVAQLAKSAPRGQPVQMRTVGELWARADTIRQARKMAQAEKAAAEQRMREAEAERSRRLRLDAIVRRGESVWREIETEIERRNAAGYDKAAGLLRDLKAISEEKGLSVDFIRRVEKMRDRHARKERFIERLAKLG